VTILGVVASAKLLRPGRPRAGSAPILGAAREGEARRDNSLRRCQRQAAAAWKAARRERAHPGRSAGEGRRER
jgi:hypothetical protein